MITIQYTWPSGLVCNFEAYEFILENENEVYLVGHDEHGNQITALGIVELDEEFYCFHVKQFEQDDYQRIIDGEAGEGFELLSDCSVGLWHGENHTKVDGIPGRLSYYLGDEPIKLAQKGPFTAQGQKYMVSTGGAFHNLVQLNKPAY